MKSQSPFSRFFVCLMLFGLVSVASAQEKGEPVQIILKASKRAIHIGGGRKYTDLANTHNRRNDDASVFYLIKGRDGYYQFRSKANGRYLHVSDQRGGDKKVSTRYKLSNDYTRFTFVKKSDGSYRIKVKGSGRFLHVDGEGDQLLTTRYQGDDDYTRFFIRKPKNLASGGGGNKGPINIKEKRLEIIRRINILRQEFDKVLKRKPGAKNEVFGCNLREFLQKDAEFLRSHKAYTTPLPFLTIDDRLMKGAQDHSDWVVRTGKFDHLRKELATTDRSKAGYSYGKYRWTDNSPLDRFVNYGYYGSMGQENIAGSALEALPCVRQWWKSDGHRRTMINPHYMRVGMGVSVSKDENSTICCLKICHSDENYRTKRRQASSSERKKLSDELFRLINEMRVRPEQFANRYASERHFFQHPMDAAALRGVNATNLKRNLDLLRRAKPVDRLVRDNGLDESASSHLRLRDLRSGASRWSDRKSWSQEGAYFNEYQGIPRAEDVIIDWLASGPNMVKQLRAADITRVGVGFGYPSWDQRKRNGWFIVHYGNPMTFFVKSRGREIVVPPQLAQRLLFGTELNPGTFKPQGETYLPRQFLADFGRKVNGVMEVKPRVKLWFRTKKDDNGDLFAFVPNKAKVGGRNKYEEFYGSIGYMRVNGRQWKDFIDYVYSLRLEKNPYDGGSKVTFPSIWVR